MIYCFCLFQFLQSTKLSKDFQNLQDSLKKLRYKTQNKEIVIGNSDKDGKIIIMNYEDYINIIEQTLTNNYEKLAYNGKDIKVQIKKITEKIVETIIKT